MKLEYEKTSRDYEREEYRERLKEEAREAILSGHAQRQQLAGRRILECVQ